MSAVTMCERNEGGSSPPLPATKQKIRKTMARRNWADMKAMNSRLRCTGDNKERRYTSVCEVEHRMTVEGVQHRDRRYLSQKEAIRRYEEREERREGLERNVFRAGNIARPQKGKAKNRASSEAAGTMGTQMTTRRFSGSYITVCCKSRKQY